jgi:serpin B
VKNNPCIFLLCLVTASFVSCTKSSLSPVKNTTTGKVLVLTATEQQKAIADNAFTFKLFNTVSGADNSGDNLFISPLSVSIAMAMTSNGSNGQTLAAIRNAFDDNGFTQAQLNAYYDKLITYLPELDPNTTLNIANSIWYRQGFNVLEPFLQTDSSYYKAKISALDFTAPSSPQTINNWVNTQTDGRIPAIINQIPADAEMYLINALYFKSTWKESFNPANTKPHPFYITGGSPVQANFMSANIDINSYYDKNVTVFEMPYSSSKYSMVIVEPQSGVSLQDVMAGLDSTQWQTWMAAIKPTTQQIQLPKFTFNYGVTLNNALTALGMGIAFTDAADFTNISLQGLKISQVQHKAYVAVDETGTEAAAVASVGVVATVAPEFTPTYTVNRPFVFAIREMGTGLVLFTGVVNNPLLTGQ